MGSMANKGRWAIWISTCKAWLHSGKRVAKYSKKAEAIKDANDFNNMRDTKGDQRVYIVKEYNQS
jgi:hypothetical protein